MVYLDTHVVVWLYAARADLLSEPARSALNGEDDLRVSPMVLLEIDFLRETGRIASGHSTVYGELHQKLGLRVCELGFSDVIEASAALEWTRDPFDRLIVGHAAASGASLITRDETVRRHYEKALW